MRPLPPQQRRMRGPTWLQSFRRWSAPPKALRRAPLAALTSMWSTHPSSCSLQVSPCCFRSHPWVDCWPPTHGRGGPSFSSWSPRSGFRSWCHRRGQPGATAARAAIAFLLIGCASAALSANRTTAIFGLYNQGTGLLFMASLAGAWAIGRSIRPEARPLIEVALVVSVLVNVGIALLAAVVDLSALSLTLSDPSGRSNALAGNPVYLGMLTVLGLALFVPRFASAPAKWAVPVIATAAAAQLSGTRLTLVVMILLLIWAGRRHGLRVGAMLVVAVILGLAGGSAIGHSNISATGRSAIVQSDGSLSDRPQTWLSARHAVAQRPFLGIGPGQFRTATSRYRGNAIARNEGAESLFTDGHNLFVEYATTTGLLGAGALLIWLIAACWRARGCLLAGALALLAMHMFEPQWVVTTPLAFLALGASASHGVTRLRPRPAREWIIPASAAAVALAMAAVLFVGQFDVRQAVLDLRMQPAAQANRLLPAWPATATVLARVWLLDAIVGRNGADYRQARAWRLIALKRDDTDPALWNDLADLDESQGQNTDAATEFLSALHYNPTSAQAMGGLARLAQARCDAGQEQYWKQRASRVLPAGADPSGALPGSPAPVPACAGK